MRKRPAPWPLYVATRAGTHVNPDPLEPRDSKPPAPPWKPRSPRLCAPQPESEFPPATLVLLRKRHSLHRKSTSEFRQSACKSAGDDISQIPQTPESCDISARRARARRHPESGSQNIRAGLHPVSAKEECSRQDFRRVRRGPLPDKTAPPTW